MPVVDIHLNNDHSVGLGDNLCLLSALAKIPDKINLYTNNDYDTFNRLTSYAKIFRIPKTSLEILQTTSSGNFPNTGWPVKLFTDYYKPKFVNVLGQTLETNSKQEKKCIAIAGFFADIPKESNNDWPWCKQRPLEYWTKLFHWIKSMDYDVITVDRANFALENKIDALVKNCKAIISYEGGMAHLAHMLKIPCFLIDWKHPSPSTVLDRFHCDFVHMSETVYIVRNDDELFSWDVDFFNNVVSQLLEGNTNNSFLNKTHTMKFNGPGIQGDVSVLDIKGNTVLSAAPIFGDNTMTQLITKYYSNNLTKIY